MNETQTPEAEAPAKRELTTEEKIHDYVGYHSPTELQVAKLGEVREATAKLIETILRNCPPSRHRASALTQLDACRMFANASIVVPNHDFSRVSLS